MKRKKLKTIGMTCSLLFVIFSLFLLIGAGKEKAPSGEKIAEKFDIEFAVVPKSLDNPVFFATRAGA
jgi:hypothetical protein